MFAKLNTGAEIPLLGFGTISYGAAPEEIKAAVLAAIQAGYRHFDTASAYHTEETLGAGLSDAFEAGLVTREEVFVTSKLALYDNDPDDVIPAIQKTLSALRLGYLDLYLMHGPIRYKKGANLLSLQKDDFLPVDIKGTWQVMEKCVEQGLTRAIGVSNFSSKNIEALLAYAVIPPAVNQIEMHPKWQQKELRAICSKASIHVSAWSPLGAPGASWGSAEVLGDPVMKDIALRHGKTPAQVALRWGVEQGVSVLPKSFNKERMVENTKIFDWELTKEDREKMDGLEQKRLPAMDILRKAGPEFWDEVN